jgi:hypothetical protein
VKLGTILGALILLLVSVQVNAEISFTTDSHRNIVSRDGFYFDEPDGPISSTRGDSQNWPSGNTNWTLGASSWSRVSPIPMSSAFWLFGAALIGFVGMSRRTNVN